MMGWAMRWRVAGLVLGVMGWGLGAGAGGVAEGGGEDGAVKLYQREAEAAEQQYRQMIAEPMRQREVVEQQYREAVAAAQKVREEKLRQGALQLVPLVKRAQQGLVQSREVAVSKAAGVYESRMEEAMRRKDLEGAMAAKAGKEGLLKMAQGDGQRLAEEVKDLLEALAGPIGGEPVKAEEAVNARGVKMTVMMKADFDKDLAGAFPRQNNVARWGMATGTTTNYIDGADEAFTALAGIRNRSTWWLRGPAGSFSATWSRPVAGQYIVVLAMQSNELYGHWGKAKLTVNDNAAMSIPETMKPYRVLVVDLGKVTTISKLRIDFNGTTHPGLTGVEIHREMVVVKGGK